MNEKKIAIITLNGYINFGNRLQNFALQEVLKSFGYKSVDTLIIEKKTLQNAKIKKKLDIYHLISNLRKKIIKTKEKRLINIKKMRFKEFSKKYLEEKKVNFENIFVLDNYEYGVVGSDQVWNPNYIKGDFDIYFLNFLKKHQRIAYAPSFGITKISNTVIEKYKKYLKEIPNLSVREQEGAQIIKDLTGKDIPVLVDPTLLLSKEKWLSISKPHKYKPKKKYVFTYFLGNMSKEYKRFIKTFSKKYHFEIVNLANLKYSKYYNADPEEFLDYINSSEIVFTDSFHGTLFSILFQKPFIVFERLGTHSMSSRINTLLSIFKLESRKWGKINYDNMFDIDFKHISDILTIERKKAYDFIKNAIK